MKRTIPIKNPITVKNLLKFSSKSKRDYIMFNVFLYSGLRVSDVRKLQVKNILNSDRIQETKTGKYRDVILPAKIIKLIQKNLKPEDYICGKKGNQHIPLTRSGINFIFKEYGELLGISLSPHTLRKTFAYTHYKQFNNLAQLTEILNHYSIADTRIYLGIQKEEMESNIEKLSFF